MLSYFMNVVIDTNIWISALISKDGVSLEIIRLAQTRFKLMASKGDKARGLALLDKLDRA